MSFNMSKFIECLQARPEIYNCKHHEHSTKKRQRLQELWNIFNLTEKEVNTKYGSLRTQYARCSKELKKSATSGAGSEELTKPKWKHFDDVAFLADATTVQDQRDNLLSNTSEQEQESESDLLTDPFLPSSQDIFQLPCSSNSVKRKSNDHAKFGKRKKSTTSTEEQDNDLKCLMKSACDTLDTFRSSFSAGKATHSDFDEHDMFGQMIAVRLRSFSDKRLVEISKIKIQSFLFDLEFGNPQSAVPQVQTPSKTAFTELYSPRF